MQSTSLYIFFGKEMSQSILFLHQILLKIPILFKKKKSEKIDLKNNKNKTIFFFGQVNKQKQFLDKKSEICPKSSNDTNLETTFCCCQKLMYFELLTKNNQLLALFGTTNTQTH